MIPGDLQSTILVVLWGLAWVFLFLATVVCAFLCFVLKGNARSIAINTLLSFATLVVLFQFTAYWLPKTANSKQAADALKLDPVHQADLLAADFTVCNYTERLGQPWKSFAMTDGAVPLQVYLKKSEPQLQELVGRHPNDPALTGRLAIVVHELGGDTQSVFKRYDDNHGVDSALVSALKILYSTGAATFPSTDLTAQIKSSLPAGWYQDAALLTAQKGNSSQQLTGESERLETRFQQWSNRYIACSLLEIIFVIVGIVTAIGALIKLKQRAPLPEPPSYGFRQVYGCFLSVLYAQAAAGLAGGLVIGIVAGYTAAIHHTKLHIPNASLPLQIVTVLAGISAALLSSYFFICKPAGIGLWKNFWHDQLNKRQLVVESIAGFAVMTAVVTATVAIGHAISAAKFGPTNVVVTQFIDASASMNLPVLIWCTLVIGAMAPISEELIFRGLLYPFFRHRWGVPAAVIVSSAAFAAIHMDLTRFWIYFTLGATLAISFERTRSLRLTTAMHALWNTWAMLVSASVLPR